MKIDVSLIRLVYNILTEDIEARDDWMLTIKKVHTLEMLAKGISKSNYFEHFFNEHLSNVHTIKRMWQKVQEEYPALRGKSWEERQMQGGSYKVASMDDVDESQMKLFTADEIHELSRIDLAKEFNELNN